MTYPGQPGPPGQQPYWQQNQYPQQQQPSFGSPPRYGQQWYGPPPSPPRPKTGLWVGLTIAAVAVITLAVTAFAWPGFLVDDDKPAAGGGAGGQTANCQKPGDSEDHEAYAQAIVDCINAKSKAVLQSLTCAGNSEARRLIDNLDKVGSAKLTKTFTVSDSEARADIEATSEQNSGAFQAVLTKTGPTWCWKRMDAAGSR